ncbi:hypothetical protein [endosymbiont 'TC1' of Trimyema compressum]|uniref:hypothetical protein n=1 Tax=endosymbiont 'TC1' of Trimyema compressum TaxID=243899 RepID=UPI00139239A8|nr:hypothetical protein [endosymbiont 'TC1' of Trimyema compressum]
MFLVACGGQATTSNANQAVPFKNDNVVDIDYLKKHLEDDNVMIVDARGEKSNSWCY